MKKKVVEARAKVIEKDFTKPLEGFMDFVREQGVVGLAVGLTVGTAVTILVKSIVDGLIIPIISTFLPGSAALANRYICLDTVNGICTIKLAWGSVLSSFISFLAIAAVVYFAVKLLRLDKLDKKNPTK